MIHVHKLLVRDDFTRADNDVRQVERDCVCGLAERRQYVGPDCVSVRYRYRSWGGGWVPAAEILSLTFPVRLCDVCSGDDSACEKCGGLLVVEDDGRPLDAAPPPTRRLV